MTSLVSKFQSIDRETAKNYVEVYDQPLGDAMVARLYAVVARVVEPVAQRLDPAWMWVSHRHGCPHPTPMTDVATGEPTEPLCICMPLCAQIDYLGYRLSRRNRLSLGKFEVDEAVYEAVRGQW